MHLNMLPIGSVRVSPFLPLGPPYPGSLLAAKGNQSSRAYSAGSPRIGWVIGTWGPGVSSGS